METETEKRKLDLIFVLFTVLSAIGVAFCYSFRFITVMFVLPALWTAAAYRSGYAVPVLTGLCIFTVVYGLLIGYDLAFAMRIFLLVAPASVLLYVAHRFLLGNTQATLYLSIVLTFGLFIIFCLNSLQQGKPAFYEVRQLFLSMLATLETGLSADNPIFKGFSEFISNIDTYFPSILYGLGAMQAFVNVLLLQLINRKKKKMPLVPIRPFGQWRLPRPYVLACMFVMIVSLFVSFSGSSKAEMILLLSNYMLNMPLSVVGAGMLYALMTRNSSNLTRKLLFAAVIVILVVIGLAMYTLSILGFIGCMNMKRRPRQE